MAQKKQCPQNYGHIGPWDHESVPIFLYRDKTSTDKTSTDKTSTDKTSTDNTSTDKTSTDKTSTAQKVYRTKGLRDKMSTGIKALQGQNVYGTKGLLGKKGLQKHLLGKKVYWEEKDYWEKMYKI